MNHNLHDESNKYDPNVIIQAANEKLAASDLEGGQMMFQSALLEWVDDAREGISGSHDPDSLREAVATLWLAYAHFLVGAKQFKSATEAYEQAVSCPIARSIGRVWLDYARFATERGKLKTAQDVYMRALLGGKPSDATGDSAGSRKGPAIEDEQDQTLLWNEFLEMMRVNKPDLTMVELEQACEEQYEQQQNKSSSSTSNLPDNVRSGAGETSAFDNTTHDDNPTSSSTPPASKRARSSSPVPPVTSSRTHVVTLDSVEDAASAIVNELIKPSATAGADGRPGTAYLPPEVSAQWMLRDGTGTAQVPEPPLFGEPTPPKLSDPTAKDILGADLALAIIQRLLSSNCSSPSTTTTATSTPASSSTSPSSGTVLLDVCRGLWTLHALKEKQAKLAIDELDKMLIQEYELLENSLDARVSVAGAAMVAAVQTMNHNERMAFQSQCNQQRQQLLNTTAWEFRQLLCIQQEMLTKLKVPGFDGPTVDASAIEMQSKICSYLHSAFYLRNRIGEGPHVNMLKSQIKRLEREVQQENPGGSSSGGGRLSPKSLQKQHQKQQQQQQASQSSHQVVGGGHHPTVPTTGGMMPSMQQPLPIHAHASSAPNPSMIMHMPPVNMQQQPPPQQLYYAGPTGMPQQQPPPQMGVPSMIPPPPPPPLSLMQQQPQMMVGMPPSTTMHGGVGVGMVYTGQPQPTTMHGLPLQQQQQQQYAAPPHLQQQQQQQPPQYPYYQ